MHVSSKAGWEHEWLERQARKTRTPPQKWADDTIDAGNLRGRLWRQEYGHMNESQLIRAGQLKSKKEISDLMRGKPPVSRAVKRLRAEARKALHET